MTDSKVQRAVAGAGKTHWLVGQYVNLVVDGEPPLRPDGVVVITFTEAAARELVDRVRRRLTAIVQGTAGPRAERARSALNGLGSAPIGTIHSFARRLLMQNAPFVGMPFGVDVVDTLEPTVVEAMGRRIDDRIAVEAARRGLAVRDLQRLGRGRRTYLRNDAVAFLSEVSGALLRAPAWASVGPAELAELEKSAWDGLAQAHERPPAVLTFKDAGDLLAVLSAEYGRVTSPAAIARTFADKLDLLSDLRAMVDSGEPEDPVMFALKQGRSVILTQAMRTRCEKSGLSEALAVADVIGRHNEAIPEWQLLRATAYTRVAGIAAVEAFVWGRSQGGSDWVLQDELLQKCLVLVRGDPEVRAALQARYPRVLLDEAQDVDATQRDLLLELVGAAGMTVVGDPQQSIYGFRGADFGTFDDLSRRLLGDASPEQLRTTRRSLPIIVDAVNAVFAQDEHHTQMAAHREAAGGSVTVVQAAAMTAPNPADPTKVVKPKAMDFLRAQADALADQVVRFLGADGPTVWDDVENCWRQVRPADIAILVRSRGPVADVERALHARHVPTTVRTSRDLARHPAAEGLTAAVLAILRPDDTRALLLALRSPLFAVTDVEITRWVLANGRLRIPQRVAAGGGAPEPDLHEWSGTGVGSALDVLRRAREVNTRRGPGRAAAFLAAEQSLAARVAAADGHAWSQAWSQVRLLIDTLTDRHVGEVASDASVARWLTDQLASGGTTNLSVLDEPEAAGVTITTVHQAKGLQWPIVMVAALTRDDAGTATLTLGDGDIFSHLSVDYSYQPETPPQVPPPELSRLMYVAMTRAQDHLVISGVGRPAGGMAQVVDGDHIARCIAGLNDPRATVVEVPVHPDHQTNGEPTRLPQAPASRPGPGDVRLRLAAVGAAAGMTLEHATPSSAGHGPATPGTSVTAVASPRQPNRWRPAPGRAAAIGDFIHGVLEQVPLAQFCDASVSADDVVRPVLPATDDLTADERAAAVRTLTHARDSQVLARAAAAGTCRRELSVSGRHESAGVLTVTLGSIDLLFAESAGLAPESAPVTGRRWVLVDYKTDSTDRSTQDFIALYRPQLEVYRRLLADVGIEVAEMWLVRMTPDGVIDTRVR